MRARRNVDEGARGNGRGTDNIAIPGGGSAMKMGLKTTRLISYLSRVYS